VVWAQVPTRVRSNRCGDGRRGLASSGTTHDGDGQVRAARDRAHRWHATFRGRVRSQHVGVGCRLVTTPRKHSSRSPDRWSVRSILSIRIASTEYLLHRRAETSALLLDPSSGYFGFGRGDPFPHGMEHGEEGAVATLVRTDGSWLFMVGPNATVLSVHDKMST
jgi:hypothetical protein